MALQAGQRQENLDYLGTGLERLLDTPASTPTSTLIAQICDYADAIGFDAGDHLLDSMPELFVYRPTLVREFQDFIVEREIIEAKGLLARDLAPGTRFRDVAGPHAASTYDRLGEVFAKIDFRNCHRAVMVGCGWRPVTTFHMHDETQVPEIIGIEIVPDAAETAIGLARKLGCDRMQVELCDALDFNYAGAQLVYVASMVTPKGAVVSRILDTADDDVQIVLWEPVSLGRLWVESALRPLDPRLVVTGCGTVNWLTTEIFTRRAG